MRRQILEVILLILLIVGIISNSLNVTGTIYDTNLANKKITLLDLAATRLFTQVFDELDALTTYIGNEITRIEIKNQINYAILDHKIENLKIQKPPDFEKLMNGTVMIINKGFAVGGVCITEDDDCYYILTVEHLLRDREDNMSLPKNAVPESNMGLAVRIEAIALFLLDDGLKELVPKSEIINTTVQTRDNTSVAGEFMYVNAMLDLGLLRVYKASGIKLEVIEITEILPKIGDEIYVLGHPLGRRYNLSKGIISNLDRPFVMGADALMTFGNSGGGVFNTKGQLIGICSRVPAYSITPKKEEKKAKERLIDAI